MQRKLENLLCSAIGTFAGAAIASGIYIGVYFKQQKDAYEAIKDLNGITTELKTEYDRTTALNSTLKGLVEVNKSVEGMKDLPASMISNLVGRMEKYENILFDSISKNAGERQQ